MATGACTGRRRLPFSGVNRSRHRYGKHRWQVADLWLPGSAEAPGPGGLPVVVLVHGGYWRSWYTKRLMDGLAGAVVAKGWAGVEHRVPPGGPARRRRVAGDVC